MENVSRDRGQLILITGLVIATILVATVLILNTAIYTENLGTRDTDSDASEVIEFRTTIESGSEEIIERENKREDPSSDNATSEIRQYTTQVERHHLRRGVIAEVVDIEVDDNVESATIEIEYRTSDLQYEDTIEVSA